MLAICRVSTDPLYAVQQSDAFFPPTPSDVLPYLSKININNDIWNIKVKVSFKILVTQRHSTRCTAVVPSCCLFRLINHCTAVPTVAISVELTTVLRSCLGQVFITRFSKYDWTLWSCEKVLQGVLPLFTSASAENTSVPIEVVATSINSAFSK